MVRIPLSPKVRWAVLQRDRFQCQYCGAGAPDVKLHVDHRIPVSRGGSNDETNLVTACEACNLGKRVNEEANPPICAVTLEDLQIRTHDLPGLIGMHQDHLQSRPWLVLRAILEAYGVFEYATSSLHWTEQIVPGFLAQWKRVEEKVAEGLRLLLDGDVVEAWIQVTGAFQGMREVSDIMAKLYGIGYRPLDDSASTGRGWSYWMDRSEAFGVNRRGDATEGDG